MAGPLMVAMVNSSVFMEMAPDSSSFGTRFGIIAWPAGAQKARATPNKAAMKNSRMTSWRPESVNHSNATARDQLESVCERDDEPAIEAVGDLAAGQKQHDERQELREPDEAQILHFPGQLPHLVAEDHVDHLPGQRRGESAVRVAREIGMAQCLSSQAIWSCCSKSSGARRRVGRCAL